MLEDSMYDILAISESGDTDNLDTYVAAFLNEIHETLLDGEKKDKPLNSSHVFSKILSKYRDGGEYETAINAIQTCINSIEELFDSMGSSDEQPEDTDGKLADYCADLETSTLSLIELL